MSAKHQKAVVSVCESPTFKLHGHRSEIPTYTLVGHFARQYYTWLLQMGNYHMAHPQLYKS